MEYFLYLGFTVFVFLSGFYVGSKLKAYEWERWKSKSLEEYNKELNQWAKERDAIRKGFDVTLRKIHVGDIGIDDISKLLSTYAQPKDSETSTS